MRPLTLAPIALLHVAAGAHPALAQDDDLTERLTALVQPAVTRGDARGLAAVVDLGGERLYAGAFGRVHFGGNVLMRTDRPLPAACLMDLFTALLALRLVDEGTLEAGQPLSKYVEGLAWEGQRVTLHHLLTHTSGVPDIEGVAAELKVVEAMFRVQDPWKQIAAQPLLSTPGTCQTFNGMNTYLAGKVLEAVVDAPLREQVQSVLLGPLGMTGTRYADDAAAQLDEVGYQVVCAGALETDPSGTARFGAASLVTTADDLVRLVRGLADKRVLSRRAWAHFVGTHRLEDGEVLRYAHGLSSTRLDSFEGFTFGGANGHERLHVVHFPGLDLTVALTADCGDGVLPALAERLVREVFDLPLAEVSDRTAPAGLLERCTGHYQLGCNRLEVRATDDAHLELVSAERPTYRLLYQGGDSFVAEVDHGLRLQFQVDNGHARSFVLTERGVDAVVVRVDEKR